MKLASFRKLSEEQDLIYNLPLTENYLVTGPPGTGKTLIALHRASMYHKNVKEPVVLSFSRLLSSYTSEAANALEINGKITTYHKWVGDTYRKFMKKDPPMVAEWVFDWSRITMDIHEHLLNNKPCLLIDEGQDLPADFYFSASLMSENVTVFADENQRITEIQSTLEDIRRKARISEENEYKLTRNYRNTREIAQVAACFYAGLNGGIPELPERRGELPVIRNTQNLRDAIDFIVRYEKNNPQQILGIFTKTLKAQDYYYQLLQGRTKNPVQRYNSAIKDVPSFDQPGVKLITLQSAKGLEFDAVFIPEIQALNLKLESMESKMLFYVALSRARDQLFLFYSGDGMPELLTEIPEELVDIE